MKSRMREDRMITVTKIHKIEYSKSRKIAKSNDHNSETSQALPHIDKEASL